MGNRLGTRVLVVSIFLVMMVFSMIAMQRIEELTNQLKSMEIVNKHLNLIQESRCKINASGFLKFPRSKPKSSQPSDLLLFPNLVSWLFYFCAPNMFSQDQRVFTPALQISKGRYMKRWFMPSHSPNSHPEAMCQQCWGYPQWRETSKVTW